MLRRCILFPNLWLKYDETGHWDGSDSKASSHPRKWVNIPRRATSPSSRVKRSSTESVEVFKI
jgi:hypothetical protein